MSNERTRRPGAPTTGRRPRGRHAAAAAAAAATVTCLLCAPAAQARPYVPPTQQELAQRVTAIQVSAPEPATGAPAPPAPRAARDPRSPAVVLSRVQATLDRSLAQRTAGGPGIDGPALARARSHVAKALSRYGTTAKPKAVLSALGAADVQLARAARSRAGTPRGTLVQLRRELVTSARRIADRIVRLAARSGARAGRVADGRAALRRGARDAGRGAPSTAIKSFGEATGIVLHEMSVRMSLLATNIRDAIGSQAIGYAFITARNGRLHTAGQSGLARTAFDMPLTGQSASKEMYVASMSKTISALALLKLLHDRGISVDSPIAPHLPGDWAKAPGLGLIRFSDLLRQTSGLDINDSSDQTLASLRDVIATDFSGLLPYTPRPPHTPLPPYVNANFGLLRILIPRIATPADVLAVYLNGLPDDAVYAALYEDYVADTVLHPARIDLDACSPREHIAVRTRYYLFPSAATPGADFGDWTLRCGATGWYLSARELASLIATLRFTTKIIDAGTRQSMDDRFLGWLNPGYGSYVEGVFGVYRAHGGDYPGLTSAGMTGCMMNFPLGVQATLLVNSHGGNIGGHPCTILRDAYDEAWAGTS